MRISDKDVCGDDAGGARNIHMNERVEVRARVFPSAKSSMMMLEPS